MRYRDKSRKPVLILSTAMAVAACLSAASVTALAAEGTTASYGYMAGQNAPRLDTEDLVAEGIVEQETADRIAEYASAKHDAIHAAYEKKSDMSTEGRHAFYSEFKGSRDWGNSAEELVEAGIITQEQADRMNRGIEK